MPWSLHGDGDVRSRLCRTRDLVRYNDEGEVLFVGRKDAQLKVRGQRIEMQEIEHHINSIGIVDEGLVVLPKSGIYADGLIAIVHGKKNHKNTTNQNADGQLDAYLFEGAEQAKGHLKNNLPGYMILTVWLGVSHLPLTQTGKLNQNKKIARLAPYSLFKVALNGLTAHLQTIENDCISLQKDQSTPENRLKNNYYVVAPKFLKTAFNGFNERAKDPVTGAEVVVHLLLEDHYPSSTQWEYVSDKMQQVPW